jgi:TRAP-type C4-dicarboxylate transport system permease small subunit
MATETARSTTGTDKVVEYVLVKLPRLIIGVLILAGIAINFANVVGRYVFLSPIIWAEEILIYIMVWCVFIGTVLVTWDGRHLKMDLLSSTLKGTPRLVVNTITTLVTIAVMLFVVPKSWGVVEMMGRLDQRSVVSEIPMTIPHFAIAFGFILMVLAVLARLRSNITGAFETEVAELAADFKDESGTRKA